MKDMKCRDVGREADRAKLPKRESNTKGGREGMDSQPWSAIPLQLGDVGLAASYQLPTMYKTRPKESSALTRPLGRLVMALWIQKYLANLDMKNSYSHFPSDEEVETR